jgi:hypothetical protein
MGDTWFIGVVTPRVNKPFLGFFSLFVISAPPGKSRKFPRSGSCGKYAKISPLLPKYG